MMTRDEALEKASQLLETGGVVLHPKTIKSLLAYAALAPDVPTPSTVKITPYSEKSICPTCWSETDGERDFGIVAEILVSRVDMQRILAANARLRSLITPQYREQKSDGSGMHTIVFHVTKD